MSAAKRLVTVRVALAMELVGLGFLLVCSLVYPPFVTSAQGVVWDWPQAGPNTNSGFCDYNVVVKGDSNCFDGPVQPSGPGPQLGQTAQLTYLDLVRGRVVLSVTAGGVTYTTAGYDSYDGALAYVGLVGLVAGALLSSAGLLFFFVAGRRMGAPAGALSAASALVCGLGIVPLLNVAGLPGGTTTSEVMTILWLVATAGAILGGVVSLARHEQPRSFAGYGLRAALAVSGLWLVWWAGILVHVFLSMG